jgi:CheY-like chemotaxis protein
MPSQKLLLADDSITIQRVIEMTFSHENMEVIAVSDGEAAIARIAADRPDIVLADIAMPKRSGYEVAAFVKGRPDLAHIPVVLLAGAFEPVDEARAQQAGSNGVLVKPFEPQHVIARVRELLGGATGDPSMPAAADIPRPAARLAGPRPVELPPRDRHEAIDINDQDYHFDDAMPGQQHVRHAPPPPVMAGPAPAEVSLDDYFDRLDEAFAGLDDDNGRERQQRTAKAARAEGPVLERDLDYIDSPPAAAPAATPSAIDDADLNPIGADAASMTVEVSEIPTLEELLGEVGNRDDLGDGFSFDGPDATADPGATRVPPGAPADQPPAAPRRIADAFSALLADEEGEPRATTPVVAQPAPEPAVSDALVEAVTARVLDRLSGKAGQDLEATVSRVVSEVAERLVRAEIERIRTGRK